MDDSMVKNICFTFHSNLNVRKQEIMIKYQQMWRNMAWMSPNPVFKCHFWKNMLFSMTIQIYMFSRSNEQSGNKFC